MQASKKSSWRTVSSLDVLPPDSTNPNRWQPGLRVVDVEDAVFEVVGHAGGQRMRCNDNPRPTTPARSKALPVFINRGMRLINAGEHRLSQLSPQAFTCLVSALAILIFWLVGGFGALTAGTTEIRSGSYVISGFQAKSRTLNGMPVAQISGEIVNTDAAARAAPRLDIVSVRNQNRIGGIALPSRPMLPSERISFTGQFQLSGQKAEDLTIVASPR